MVIDPVAAVTGVARHITAESSKSTTKRGFIWVVAMFFLMLQRISLKWDKYFINFPLYRLKNEIPREMRAGTETISNE
jgi:hypothetical protein